MDLTQMSPQQSKLIALIEPIVQPLGYEVVSVEVNTHRSKVLRVFIDRSIDSASSTPPMIGVEDCATVSRALDEPLEQSQELDAIFHGTPYELEVSSPGVDRVLRTLPDFIRFSGRRVRVHTFRPLLAGELLNDSYLEKNPKQKNFLGVLHSTEGDRISILLEREGKKLKGSKKKNVADLPTGDLVWIPLGLITKANLEPVFEFDDEE